MALQAMRAVLAVVPSGACIFNFSIDYLGKDLGSGELTAGVTIRHQGRKTLVAEVDVTAGMQPVAKALCTLLL